MNTDFESAAFACHHHALSDGIHKLVTAFARGYAALAHHQFDAPWKSAPARRTATRCR